MKNPSKTQQRGQVLILTAFFVFVLFTLAFGFFRILPVELNSAKRTKQAVTAQVVAESGVQEAIVWLESQPPQKILTQEVLDEEFNRSVIAAPLALSEAWSYQVEITPNPDGVFVYDVVSQAAFDGTVVREARATLSRENFARYALFIDRWRDDLLFSMTPRAVRGPFHTNDHFRLAPPSSDFWSPGPRPFVSGTEARMTHARSFSGGSLEFTGDGNAYYSTGGAGVSVNSNEDLVPYNEDGAIESRYGQIVRGGRSNLSVTEHIELPYSADQLRLGALEMGEDQPPFTPPAEVGFYLPGGDDTVTGGLFIVGDVSLELALSAEGNQVHNITQVIPEEAYRWEEQVVRQRPIYDTVFIAAPEGETQQVRELETREVDVVRQEQTGTRTETRTRTERVQVGVRQETRLVGGISQVVSVPVYDTRTITETIEVPIYGDVPGREVRTVWTGRYITVPATGRNVTVLVGYEDYNTTDVHFLSPEEFEANPGAFPGAARVFLPGGPKTGQVVEVTAEAGYEGHGVTAPKGSTVILDYDGNVTLKEGNLNGVTFVDGNIEALEGTTKGALGVGPRGEEAFLGRYIVANPDWNRSLTIKDDLLAFYDGDDPERQEPGKNFTLRRGSLSPHGGHALGLVGGEVFMGPDRGDPLDVYGVILAGRSIQGADGQPVLDAQGRPQVQGGFGTLESLMSGSYGLNNFRLYGGIVEANAYAWNKLGIGLKGDLIYDPAVADALPRFPRSQEVITLRYADRFIR